MYRYQHDLFKKEEIYIAGPECFYTYGYDALGAMKARAHALGFGITLPNDHPLDMENPDKQKRADSIFADFDKVILEDEFKRGIERLKVGCSKNYKIVLLGAMQEPIRCHRAILLGKELIKAGFDVKHIMHEGDLKVQSELEEQLLEKYFEDRNQLTIDSLLGNAISREDMIKEGYKLANKEIGYRIEKLKDNKSTKI